MEDTTAFGFENFSSDDDEDLEAELQRELDAMSDIELDTTESESDEDPLTSTMTALPDCWSSSVIGSIAQAWHGRRATGTTQVDVRKEWKQMEECSKANDQILKGFRSTLDKITAESNNSIKAVLNTATVTTTTTIASWSTSPTTTAMSVVCVSIGSNTSRTSECETTSQDISIEVKNARDSENEKIQKTNLDFVNFPKTTDPPKQITSAPTVLAQRNISKTMVC